MENRLGFAFIKFKPVVYFRILTKKIMKEELVWKTINPLETLSFWDCILKKKPLPKASAIQRPFEQKEFKREDIKEFLGQSVIREASNEFKKTDLYELTSKSATESIPTKVGSKKQSLLPYSAVGKLFFALVINGEYQLFEGSAFVLQTKNENSVFTAGHCLFSEYNSKYPRQWAQHVIFIPFFEMNHRPLLDYFEAGDVYVASGLGVARKWYESEQDKRYGYDLGCMTLEPGVKNLREKTGTLGWLAGDFELGRYTGNLSLGYPITSGFGQGGLWETGFETIFLNFIGGEPHIRMKGNRFSQGASGGPVLMAAKDNPNHLYVVGLNACLSDYGLDFLYWDAPRFGVTFLAIVDCLENK